MPVMAQDDGTMLGWDSQHVDWADEDTVWVLDTTVANGTGFGRFFITIPKDTTRYYVFDVKERTKCDTFTVTFPCPDPSYAERGMSCLMLHQKTVVECNDTTWAPKIQIWLTPIELEQLMELIGK